MLFEGGLFRTYISVVCWMMYFDVVRMDIIGLTCFYIVNFYSVLNYNSFVYCDGANRFVSFLRNVVRFEISGILVVRLLACYVS